MRPANFSGLPLWALNGLIGMGDPLIGPPYDRTRLTAYHGIDHARTLASSYRHYAHRRKEKQEKLLQYGERIWNITSGTVDERIDRTIQKTIGFFESVGIPTKLPDYEVPVETIVKIMDRTRQRGSKFGEKADIGPEEIRLILEDRL